MAVGDGHLLSDRNVILRSLKVAAIRRHTHWKVCMDITNRTGGIRTWIIWDISDTIYWGAKGCEWIYPGQSHQVDTPDGFKIYLIDGQYSATQLNKFGNYTRIFSNGNASLLMHSATKDGLVDWQPYRQKYIDSSFPGKKATASYTAAAGAAAASLKGLSEGIKALETLKLIPVIGPGLSVFTSIVSSIIDATGRGMSTSKPLDTLALVDSIREVVRSENDRQTAQSAAATFANGYNYLSSLNPDALGPHEYEDLKRNTEDFCAPGRDPMNYLTAMNTDKSKAKMIMPAYLLGISAYLRFLWFHFVISIDDGDTPTEGLIKNYILNMQRCLDGLKAASVDVEAFVSKVMTESMITISPEREQLKSALYMNQMGMAAPDALNSAIDDVRAVIALLAKDVELIRNNQPPQYFYKQQWRKLASAAA